MTRLPLIASVLLALTGTAAQAAPRVPAQYRGTWCMSDEKGERPYHRCREIKSDVGDMVVTARGASTGESLCKVLAVTAIPGGGHKIREKCAYHGGGTTPDWNATWVVSSRWRLLSNSRLELK